MSIIDQLLTGAHTNMSNVFRYSIRRVIQKENLAEHSFYVALLADLISEDVVKNNPEVKINRELVLRF
jgi:5'-deoxynucleotidase YfbR-like HD superfamily hydrolase